MPLLTKQELENVRTYTYTMEGDDVLDPLFMIFWNRFIDVFPWHWSANSITLAGLILNVSYMIVLFALSPDGTAEIPRWLSLACALFVFAYLTLDAMDGKQARRTVTENALTEFMDHACDAVSQVCVVLGACISARIGVQPDFMLAFVFLTVLMFYLYHWQTYVTRIEYTSFLDALEAAMYCICIHLINAVFGPSIWNSEMPFFGIEVYKFILYMPVLPMSIQLLYKLKMMFTENGTDKIPPFEKYKMLPLPSVVTYMVMGLGVAYNPYSTLFSNNPCLFLFVFGIAFAKPTHRILVAYLTKRKMEALDFGILGLLFVFINQLCGAPINEAFTLCVCLVYSSADLLWYDVRFVSEVCGHLRIYCFDITKRPNGNHGLSNEKYMMLKHFDPTIHKIKGYRSFE